MKSGRPFGRLMRNCDVLKCSRNFYTKQVSWEKKLPVLVLSEASLYYFRREAELIS